MKMSYYKKYLAVAVILLFIGVAFAPSVNANVVKDDLVEFDVFFGKKHTVKLTQEEADELELLIDEIKKNPNMLRDYLSETISKGVSLQNILRIIFLLIGLFFIYTCIYTLIFFVVMIIVILRGPPVPP